MKIIHKLRFLKLNEYLDRKKKKRKCRKATLHGGLQMCAMLLCSSAGLCRHGALLTCGVAELGLESDTCEWPAAC